ncbi:MAG TPA: DUF1330 domain-containing protein [Candidatus Baltobacteraceae bacterium]|nr:DUF1330 domain-containing protein [Candidatus Baltobacteraceae bacterium]
MEVDDIVEPTGDQLRALAASPDDGPVMMLNLLAYREGGREHYRAYMAVAQRALKEVGGSVVLFGRASEPFIGPPDERWDEVLIVRYPSRAAFLRMLSFDYYRDSLVHRRNALQRTRIFPLTVDTAS